jgi:hypothetical protein
MADIVAAWPDAVGAQIARHAWPSRLARDGTLHVATSSAAWAHELGLLAQDVLERLRSAAPAAAPARLRFAVGRVPEPGRQAPERTTRATAPEPTAAQRAAAEKIAAGVRDPTLRELVARAAAAGLANAASGRGL